MILLNNYSDTYFNYIFVCSLLPSRAQKIMANFKKTLYIQSELFSYYYSVVIELLAPQSEAASKLVRKFSDKNDY